MALVVLVLLYIGRPEKEGDARSVAEVLLHAKNDDGTNLSMTQIKVCVRLRIQQRSVFMSSSWHAQM